MRRSQSVQDRVGELRAEGLTVREIADRLAISTSAVYCALDRLRRRVQPPTTNQ